MGRRGRKAALYAARRQPTGARESLERKWRSQLVPEPRFAAMVTASAARQEPFHRWMHYKQGFSPALVRGFLKEAFDEEGRKPQGPLLDPFSGSGTAVIEWARRGVPAIGVEALASLVFLASVMAEKAMSPLPDLVGCSSWQSIADRLHHRLHQAALMLAVGRQHTTSGRLNKQAEPIEKLLRETFALMAEDLRFPLPLVNPVQPGDARDLQAIDDGSIGGILTSPPYLSRHDYTKIAHPFETVYRHWYGCDDSSPPGEHQLRGKPGRFRPSRTTSTLLPAVTEVVDWLDQSRQSKLATAVRHYFEDLFLVVEEWVRVLRSGAPCWVVLGGARWKGVYIPTDLIVADYAAAQGLTVESIRIARYLIGSRRSFGGIGPIAPRESVLVMTRS